MCVFHNWTESTKCLERCREGHEGSDNVMVWSACVYRAARYICTWPHRIHVTVTFFTGDAIIFTNIFILFQVQLLTYSFTKDSLDFLRLQVRYVHRTMYECNVSRTDITWTHKDVPIDNSQSRTNWTVAFEIYLRYVETRLKFPKQRKD